MVVLFVVDVVVGGLVARRVVQVVHVPRQVVVVQRLDGLVLGVRALNVLLQVGVVVERHPALVAHHVLRLEVHLVNVLAQVRVLPLAVRTLGLRNRKEI